MFLNNLKCGKVVIFSVIIMWPKFYFLWKMCVGYNMDSSFSDWISSNVGLYAL